jgi:hypothetical protein
MVNLVNYQINGVNNMDNIHFEAIQFKYHFKVEFNKYCAFGVDTHQNDTNIGQTLTNNVEDLTYDYATRTVTISARELASLDVIKCISNLHNEINIKLNHVDKKGNTIKSIIFKCSKLEAHQCKYDYKSGDIVKHTLTYKFDFIKIV